MKTHIEEKTYQCAQCSKFFTKQCDLKMHMHLHTEKNSINCIQSNETYSGCIDLNKETQYRCSQCEKSFSKDYDLKEHMNEHMEVHTEEKPDHCNNTKPYQYNQSDE